MNSKLLTLMISLLLAMCTLRLEAQGSVVVNGVTYGGYDGLGYTINVVHNPATAPAGGSTTGFDLIPNGANTFQFDPVVDVGVRVFLVSPNDHISLQPILNMNYPELTSPNSYVFNSGTPFYVGLYTGNQSFAPPNGIYSDPLFGWAELENVGGTIQLLDSALEYKGGGIIAGTETILATPEPQTWALLFLGGGALLLRRRKIA